ncbi:MAG: deoxyribose-phosphate aldolase [Ahrensia sp.]|nr:deoxyribose-phosphate aldolase [Ahrensia sp.]
MERENIAKRAVGLIDLTNLNGDCSRGDIEALCARAQTPFGNTAAVCIWPHFVAQAKQLLAETSIVTATVVNFPHGGIDIKAVMRETKTAVGDGADEIDLVMPYGAFKSGERAHAADMISTIRAVTHGQAKLKVILETGELAEPDLIYAASMLALEEGADFIKTSTGKVAVNATLESAKIMLGAIKEFGDLSKGFKPAGGIKTVEDCGAYLSLADGILGETWAKPSTFRFGASGVLDDVLAALKQETQPISAPEGY